MCVFLCIAFRTVVEQVHNFFYFFYDDVQAGRRTYLSLVEDKRRTGGVIVLEKEKNKINKKTNKIL